MKRVVVTGMGIVSSLGNDVGAVLESLREGRSGLAFDESFAQEGLRSHVSGRITVEPENLIDRKLHRFMNRATGYGYLAMQQCIADAGLGPAEIHAESTGIIMGTGGPATDDTLESVERFRAGGVRRTGPYRVTRGMNSSLPSVLATAFGIRGINYSITSACATSSHCIGAAMEQIQFGKQSLIFTGGADHSHWSQALQFDAMGALSTRYNATPQQASRPYDVNRDGFVISGGAGVLVLEELEHALARGARIYGEILGYGATSDGKDMVQPSGEGAERAMRHAIRQAQGRPIDYVNAHGTGTPVGDLIELRAIRRVFGSEMPLISSTKSLSGHGLGAAGVHESIYSLLMMQHGFLAANANLDQCEPEGESLPLVRAHQKAELQTVMSNSFGFGGTNACLVFGRYQ